MSKRRGHQEPVNTVLRADTVVEMKRNNDLTSSERDTGPL